MRDLKLWVIPTPLYRLSWLTLIRCLPYIINGISYRKLLALLCVILSVIWVRTEFIIEGIWYSVAIGMLVSISILMVLVKEYRNMEYKLVIRLIPFLKREVTVQIIYEKTGIGGTIFASHMRCFNRLGRILWEEELDPSSPIDTHTLFSKLIELEEWNRYKNFHINNSINMLLNNKELCRKVISILI